MAEDRKDAPSDPGAEKKTVHIYDDDLHEEDNQLPNWWLWLFYGTVAFGVAYWLVYHDMHVAKHPDELFADEAKALKEAEAKRLAGRAVSNDMLTEMSKDAATVESGKGIFMTNCVACHKADAGGMVGPNLTDPYWIHGGKPENVYRSVHDGWPEKGMTAWFPVLGEENVRKVTAYVLTLKNTNVAGGKEKQGELDQ